MANPLKHTARKRFGQNFLHDPVVIERIVQAINPQPGQFLVEIGPGLGAITLPLLRIAKTLHAVELDRDLVADLATRAAGIGELHIHQHDALRFDFTKLAGRLRLRVVGNLPYNISTPILFHLMEQADCIEDMHFMLQKEVVDRMAASPGSRDYGRLSVMIQHFCRVEPLFRVGPGAFRPAPKVDSAIVRLTPRLQPDYPLIDHQDFSRLVRQAFSQRRKTLRNTLKGLLSDVAIRELGIDPSARPETITLEQYARLANRLSEENSGETPT